MNSTEHANIKFKDFIEKELYSNIKIPAVGYRASLNEQQNGKCNTNIQINTLKNNSMNADLVSLGFYDLEIINIDGPACIFFPGMTDELIRNLCNGVESSFPAFHQGRSLNLIFVFNNATDQELWV